MWCAQLAFSVEDWSEALVGNEGDLRPPFTIVEQILDDGIQHERLEINTRAFIEWWRRHKVSVVTEFNNVTSR